MFTVDKLLEDANVFQAARILCGYKHQLDLAKAGGCSGSAISGIEGHNVQSDTRVKVIRTVLIPKLVEGGFMENPSGLAETQVMEVFEVALKQIATNVDRGDLEFLASFGALGMKRVAITVEDF